MKGETGQHVSLVICMGAFDGLQHMLSGYECVLHLNRPMRGHVCGGDSPPSAGCLRGSESKGIMGDHGACLL